MAHVVKVFTASQGDCACTGTNTWENAARGLEARLRQRLKMDVRLEMVPLFSREFFAHPEVMTLVQTGNGEPPIVTLNNRVIQAGGKLRERTIREALEQADSKDTRTN